MNRLKSILDFIEHAGISLTKVATATGMNRPTLNNKISWLYSFYDNTVAASRSRFLRKDLELLEDYLVSLQAKLDYTISCKPIE